MSGSRFQLARQQDVCILRLQSADGTNRLSRDCVLALSEVLHELAMEKQSLVITGNDNFFSAGAELEEVAALDASSGYEFSKMGQALMQSMEQFPAPVYAAVSGYCMGGGLDLALACHWRIASPRAVFGHRGAALGLITGWGGTQRLPRLIGKARALEMFVGAEKVSARQALEIGLVDAVVDDPVEEAVRRAMSSGNRDRSAL
jgi:enoyl-CoA hydratase/carnithine racemase